MKAARQLTLARRYARILDLVAEHPTWSFQRIADELIVEGELVSPRYTRAQAHQDFRKALAGFSDQNTVERMRTMQNVRLATLLEAVWPRALAGSVDHVQAALNVLKVEAQLNGLNAPTRTQIDVTTHIDQVSAMAVAAVAAGLERAQLSDAQRQLVLAGIRDHFGAARPPAELSA